MAKHGKDLLNLFTAFFKIGLFTFGGGFAMIPLIEKEIVNGHGWATKEEILDVFALAQSVPGAIGVNTAVFIGFKLRGALGALTALLGVVTPSVFIMVGIAHFFVQFRSNIYLDRAFSGIKAGVVGLIFAATWRVGKTAIMDRFGFVIALSAFILSVFGIIPVVWVIVLGALSGYLYYKFRKGVVTK